MKFSVKSTDVLKIEADMLAVFASGPVLCLSEEAKMVDAALGGTVAEAIVMEGFTGEQAKTFLVHTHGKIASKNVLFAGLGEVKKLTVADVLNVSAAIGRRAKNAGVKRLAVAVSQDVFNVFPTAMVGQLLTEGIALGAYAFTRHKNEAACKKEKTIDEVIFLAPANKIAPAASGVQKGEIVSEGVCFARDLVNEPSSVATPTYLANIAQDLAKNSKNVSCNVLDANAAKKFGMGAFLGIAQGSEEEPKFIHLTYKGGGGKTVVLVGKGITFDSGGLSLKPASSMETMKSDMAGGAAVLGVIKILSQLQPKVNVVGLIAATENMPSGRALKPGDIVTAMNGKTIEVFNTDAEGRLILADALSYAVSQVKPDVIIDLATLTGACMVALGEDIAGLFANKQILAESLLKAGSDTGERVWELPLAREYKEEMLKSAVADMKNVSQSHYGGAINGALFLSEFVPETMPWAHIDIAGPSFAEKDGDLIPKGGTGFGVRMLIDYLLNG